MAPRKRLQPKQWRIGDLITHRDGTAYVLAARKDDDSGWWLHPRGGLADFAATSDWHHVHAATVRALMDRR